MSYRNQPQQSQASAAEKAGLSERSARRIESGEHKTHKPPRDYKTRKDPFDGLFDEYSVPLLMQNPGLQPITLLDELDKIAPGKFDQSQLSTYSAELNAGEPNMDKVKKLFFVKFIPCRNGYIRLHLGQQT
jgi:hypothetical protein